MISHFWLTLCTHLPALRNSAPVLWPPADTAMLIALFGCCPSISAKGFDDVDVFSRGWSTQMTFTILHVYQSANNKNGKRATEKENWWKLSSICRWSRLTLFPEMGQAANYLANVDLPWVKLYYYAISNILTTSWEIGTQCHPSKYITFSSESSTSNDDKGFLAAKERTIGYLLLANVGTGPIIHYCSYFFSSQE